QAGLVNRGKANAMPLIQQRRCVRIAEVELVIEIHAVKHDALRPRVRRLQGESTRHATLQLEEQRVVMILRWADQFVDLAEIGILHAIGKQSAINIRQNIAGTVAGKGDGVWGTYGVRRSSLQRIQ